MLTLHNVGSAGQALHYFSKDNYYTQDEGLEHSAWFGAGAAKLGLTGKVDREKFFDLLSGRIGQQQLGKIVRNDAGERAWEHRPGIDLTFSAPKSVSIAAEIFEDREVRLAHEEAVKAAVQYVEERVAQARMTVDGETTAEATGNVVAAMFRHNTSRDLDPDTHTHVLLMNATMRNDGEWRSLVNDEIYVQQKVIGAVYTSALAQALQKRGYEITAPDAKGNFELAGITREQVEHFSQRKAAIDRRLEERGIDPATATAEQREQATLATRQKKVDVDHEALNREWRDRADAVGLDYETIKARAEQALEAGGISRGDRLSGRDALVFATAHLVEREVVMSPHDMLETALEHATGRASHAQIMKAYDRLVEEGKIVQLPDGNVTTERMLGSETWSIAQVADQRGKVPAIAPLELVNERIDQIEARMRIDRQDPDFTFSVGQREGVVLATTSQDRYVAVQGLAGVGKTTMVKAAVQIAQEQGYLVRAMAPTGKAAEQLAKDSGIDAETVSMFEIQERRRQDDLKHIRQYAPDMQREREFWLVDESSFLSQRQMAKILHMGERANARVVFLGDKLQLQAIEAGKPFEILQEEAMATAMMTEINRQKNSDLKRAVDITVGRDGLKPGEQLIDLNLTRNDRAFHFLQEAGMVTEIDEPDKLIEHIAKAFVDRGRRRNETIIITPFNADRTDINAAIRTELMDRGEIRATEGNYPILDSVGMTRAQQKEAQYYRPGMVVRFGRDYEKIDASRGEYMTVRSIRHQDGIVMLAKEDGSELAWEPKKYNRVEVYEREKRDLSEGDVIRFTRGDQSMKNGHEAEVVKLDKGKGTLKLADGQLVRWDFGRQQHWDHAYAATVHTAQGATREEAMLHIPSHKLDIPDDTPWAELRQNDVLATIRRIFGNRSFYVGETRSVHRLQVMTTDAEIARKAVALHQDKGSAVEILNDYEQQPKRQVVVQMQRD
jgi:conjugative relaxase-like TrwC/TraI family protein